MRGQASPCLILCALLCALPSGALPGPASPAHTLITPKRNESARPKRITIDVVNADVRNVIRLIADVSGSNFVLGDDVQGRVTIKLKDVPWPLALRVILRTKGLGLEREGGIIRIAPQSVLDAEAQAKLARQQSCLKDGPLKLRTLQLSYARAAEMAEHVKVLLTDRGSVSVDERTNTLLIRDVACSTALRAFAPL